MPGEQSSCGRPLKQVKQFSTYDDIVVKCPTAMHRSVNGTSGCGTDRRKLSPDSARPRSKRGSRVMAMFNTAASKGLYELAGVGNRGSARNAVVMARGCGRSLGGLPNQKRAPIR